MRVNKSSGSTYEQPPLGPQAAILTRTIDIGTHTDTSPQYGTTRRRQVVFTWELAEKMDDGRPFTVQKFYTASLNEKANLAHDITSWFGKAPPEDLDTSALLGHKCLLNLSESATGKAKVSGISRLPKGMPGPDAEGPLLVFDLDEPDWSVYEQLTEWMQNKIRESEEWQAANASSDRDAHAGDTQQPVYTDRNPPPVTQAPADLDDDIPF